MLDRLMIIRTTPYALEEIVQIAAIRAGVEQIKVDNDALALLGQIGVSTSLRHVLQLLTPAAILAKAQGLASVTRGAVEEASSLFLDAKRSAQLIRDTAGFLH